MVPSGPAGRDPPIWWIRTGVALIVGCSLLVGGLALTAARHDSTRPGLVVYFQPSATPAQLEDVKRSLETMADVRSVRYLNQAQVLAERIALRKRTGIDDLLVDSVADRRPLIRSSHARPPTATTSEVGSSAVRVR